MPLPPEVDANIRAQFEMILSKAQEREVSPSAYMQVRTRLFSLMNYIAPGSKHFEQLREEINKWNSSATEYLRGYVKAVKADYETGMYENLSDVIEANVAADYMGQAERLLGEGVPGRFDHVPAAVLAGAVLEDALHRLCQRQTPPIDLQNEDGSPKTLDPLIGDLQKAQVFNKAKGDLLRSWAKTRNYAAHGEFEKFTRSDVEVMILSIRVFIADYL